MTDCRGGLAGWLADIFRPTDAVIPFPCEAASQTAPLALAVAAVRVRIGLRLQGEAPARRTARS